MTTRAELKALMVVILREIQAEESVAALLRAPKVEPKTEPPRAVVNAEGGPWLVWLKGATKSWSVRWGAFLAVMIPLWPTIQAFLEAQLLSAPFSPETKVYINWLLGLIVGIITLYIRSITNTSLTERGLKPGTLSNERK